MRPNAAVEEAAVHLGGAFESGGTDEFDEGADGLAVEIGDAEFLIGDDQAFETKRLRASTARTVVRLNSKNPVRIGRVRLFSRGSKLRRGGGRQD